MSLRKTMVKLALDYEQVVELTSLPEGSVQRIYNGCPASGYEIRRLANGLRVRPGDLMLMVIHPSEVNTQLNGRVDEGEE